MPIALHELDGMADDETEDAPMEDEAPGVSVIPYIAVTGMPPPCSLLWSHFLIIA